MGVRLKRDNRQSKMIVRFAAFKTSVGWMGVALTPRGILRLSYPAQHMAKALDAVAWAGAGEPAAEDPRVAALAQELDVFFEGKPVEFSVPPDLSAGTPFQRRVWAALLKIPRGETRTYQWIARRLKRPTAVRAVGAAVGANPIPFVVPCHRVIGTDGSLCGFAGGLALKRRLLAMEDAFRYNPSTARR
jgi:methylated-DNA-[protein]-cysteine S-methyltransferase